MKFSPSFSSIANNTITYIFKKALISFDIFAYPPYGEIQLSRLDLEQIRGGI
ncbi:MAG: hypothetical protein KJ887_00340 [Candidatus Omnitrophica bacterium]|nr:hypothetical protein [Candidatus Omnitrophota bacterium]MBU1047164.1 hypothetical protein [Candidatus Omnitrophota bacterium]MBU1630452.1 hypothetical protein [Candidatus Omnitrophota bacterium]MBU1889558.1 hypothetical protein [Candidatus Omnitrophota bacterium]